MYVASYHHFHLLNIIQPQNQSCSIDFQADIVIFPHVFINAPHPLDVYKGLQSHQKVSKAVTEQLAWCNTVKQQCLSAVWLGFFCLLNVQEGCKKDCKLSPFIMRKISSMKLFHHVQNSLQFYFPSGAFSVTSS